MRKIPLNHIYAVQSIAGKFDIFLQEISYCV